jgi:tyrosyl-tRNA synthetase
MSESSILDRLDERGFVEQISDDEALRSLLMAESVPMYVGFDPTAESLHVGHLLPIMALAHMQRAGHRPIVLVGGATGMIGDPSGRSAEREFLNPERIEKNAASIREQLAQFIDFSGENPATMVNNANWFRDMNCLEWLRDVGKNFSVNYMMGKESVRNRLKNREQGISYTEFSYMLLQAYDFLHLHREYGCMVQAGGNDQWGNITAGIELVRKAEGAQVFGLTFPLIQTAGGEKFGKSAGNAVWLDADRTSPYEFYQFWINTDDRDVERYLKYFTFLALDDIEELCDEHREHPERREAQTILAQEVTRLVHGENGLRSAERATDILFGEEITDASDDELANIFSDVPSTTVSRNALEDGVGLLNLLTETGACSSNSEARRLVKNGGAYLNNRRVTEPTRMLDDSDLASQSMMVLRVGKKKYYLVHAQKHVETT